FVVSDDKAVDIKSAVIQEGANGFYVEVICNDRAAEGGNRSFYSEADGQEYYGLSQRCQLNDEAVKKIALDPPGKKTYITGGKAGFRVFGEFTRGEYTLTVPRGVRSVDGGVVIADFAHAFSVPARKPQLSFAASGRYLPRSAWNNLGVKHLNIEAVNLFVRQVP